MTGHGPSPIPPPSATSPGCACRSMGSATPALSPWPPRLTFAGSPRWPWATTPSVPLALLDCGTPSGSASDCEQANFVSSTWPAQASSCQTRHPFLEGTSMFDRVRLIDLSVPLEDGAVSEPLPPRIRYATHNGEGLSQMQRLLGVKAED